MISILINACNESNFTVSNFAFSLCSFGFCISGLSYLVFFILFDKCVCVILSAMPRSRRSASPIRRPMAERRYSPPPPSPRQPAPIPQQHSAVGAPRQGSGLMGQMAATAGGVAVGSVVGHGISSALFGGGSQEVAPSPAQQPQAYQQPSYQSQPQQNQVCGWELQQFLNCAQQQQDLSACQGFNDALTQCKRNNGLM